ncbi:MAG TPA: YhbY family RNA-binding protein [Verrucomicrobiae bacterium]|nr:YhbY family RNA-binding protein [Verrucomicrobiae bacterium]
MSELSPKQIAYLRGLGQRLEPTVHVGQAGLSDALLASLNEALDNQELVKLKFHAHKEEKKQLAPELAARSSSVLVQRVGHVVLLYRQQPDPAKRKIQVPAHEKPPVT